MKKQILILCFMLVAMAGFSQISKTDASAFLTRNPYSKMYKFVIENMPDLANNTREAMIKWNIADLKSITAMDSGLSILIKSTDFDKEKFIPYTSIRSLFISGDNSFVISLL